ncbi:DEAD/DEAH box helicase family protein [Methylocystis sp. H62]|uniref:helicase-related protein n=1 Tax=Methylocystis sp. H62 TaxID=2785789 RepID=UPI0018C294F1|nr:helicase-related protein [Methylocystis sp. H62]MBG0794733.1 DEAD/DEAH box helicase family protein [Methylocystis sp. H62]
MSLLQDHVWKLKYTLDDGDLIRLFYVPALRSAQRYDRITGYFSATALALAARGVEGLVLNDGRMRLLVGCTLGAEEIEAVEKGEAIRAVIERQILATPDFFADPKSIDALQLLAWMIARGYLDLKVAIPCDLNRRPVRNGAIFHEKTGIIEDKTGDRIAFTGSINETAAGWMTNWESFNCFTSWNDGPRVEQEEGSFAKLWADKATRAMVFDVPTAVREKLLGFLPDPDKTPLLLQQAEGNHTLTPTILLPSLADEAEAGRTPIDEERSELWRRIANAAQSPNGGERVGEATSAVVPWAHQVRAFQRLYQNWPPKLLIADEVGLGKTIQAGLLLRQAWLADRIKRALVLAPKSVCKQWQIELREKFNLNWPIYDGHKLIWYHSPATDHCTIKFVTRADWHREPFVIMSSHLARRQDRRPELLTDAGPWGLVVLDEAHHARRRGAGTAQESGPNALLRLMRELRHRTEGLVLLTATPLQVHPVELWDLLDLLGLPAEWTPSAFERFFVEVRKETITNESLDWLAGLFRATERVYGQISREEAEKRSKLSRFQAKRVLDGLREDSSIPRRQFTPEQRRGAIALIRRTTPVRTLISRHTRELLRKMVQAGKIDARIANRRVEDKFIHLSPEESALYTKVENYISHAYNAAAQEQRNAVGFVMTIYRRRLASSFFALRNTLEKRKSGVTSGSSPEDELRLEEDAADLGEAGDDIDTDALSEAERQALNAEEVATIDDLVAEIGTLPTDTKAIQLVGVLAELQAAGFPQAMVFTQFTDTMDYLRDHLAKTTGRSIMCFSGRGGEVRGNDGAWKTITREDVKRRFREGKADILVCTDAAAEGLNFQFCGALVNYDMPWNPMRVEQRIGRIDRLGQRFTDIRIVNLHYADTVEADVYMAARNRIKLFESVVGGLQPILARLPTLIKATVLSAGTEPGRTEGAVRDINAAIDVGQAEGINLDDFADADLEMPVRPEPAITLADLRAILDRPILLPKGTDAARLDAKDYRYENGILPKPIRVTVDRDFYEMHSESVEFWTPGSPAFPDLSAFRE